MVKKPEILGVETVAQTRLFTVEQLDLRFSNGTQVQFERIRGSAAGAVLIVPVVDGDQVLLIREYAAGSERYELGLPKGRVEDGEDPLAAANRELMEEVGYGARQLRLLKSLSLAPGYLSQTTHIILARDLYPERLPGDEPEAIEVVPWRLSRLDKLLARDDCTEARSIAALFMVREILNHDG
jgi:ADP-ribose diphosphatase